MTSHLVAPTKSLEMAFYGQVTDVFTNLSELIHPNDCYSQGDPLKMNFSCFSLNHLEIHL